MAATDAACALSGVTAASSTCIFIAGYGFWEEQLALQRRLEELRFFLQ